MNNKDDIRNISIGASASIPIFGGVISYILNSAIPSCLERQYEEFLAKLENESHEIQKKIDIEMITNPEFVTLCYKAISNAVTEYSEEKKQAYRNIIVNAIYGDLEFDLTDYYIHLLYLLSKEQFMLLNYIYKLYVLNKEIDVGVGEMIRKNPDYKNYVVSIYAELARLNLTRGNSLTSLGVRFCQFINKPNCIYRNDENGIV